jgi:hypothetical protein
VLVPRPAHEQRHAHTIFEGMSLEVKEIFIRVSDSLKKLAIWDKIKPLDFKRVGLESG